VLITLFFFSQKKFWGKVLTQIKTLCLVIIYNTRRKKKVARFLFGVIIRPLLKLCSLYWATKNWNQNKFWVQKCVLKVRRYKLNIWSVFLLTRKDKKYLRMSKFLTFLSVLVKSFISRKMLLFFDRGPKFNMFQFFFTCSPLQTQTPSWLPYEWKRK